MKDLKNLVVAGLTLAGVATSSAQQVVKNVQGNILKHLTLGNGVLLPTVSGGNNIDVGNSGEGGTASIYKSDNTSIPTSQTLFTNITIPTETIGSNTITRQAASQQQNTRTTDSNPDVSLSLTRKRARTDINGDGQIDGIMTIRDLPTLQTTLAPIPLNTKIAFSSPTLKNLSDLTTLISNRPVRCNRNGTERVTLTNNPITGNPLQTLQDRGTLMGINDFSMFGKASLYPNPSNGPLTIQTNNPNDKKVEIYNLSGQMISRIAISGENSEIDISSLATGPYLLTTQDIDGNKTINKIIKK